MREMEEGISRAAITALLCQFSGRRSGIVATVLPPRAKTTLVATKAVFRCWLKSRRALEALLR